MASKIDSTKMESVKGDVPKVTQEPGTQPRARDAAGFELDEFNLPIAGPERAARLAQAGLPDPLDDRDGFERGMKEASNG